ncbi:MAG TPA: acyl-CoA dehydrogenase family protein, partial [Dongiaceae bacterium]
MDLSLATADIEAQARARAFAETWLHPNEIACDERTLSKKTLAEIKKNVLRYKLNGVNHTKEDGGHGYTPLQQILICEQLGRATNGMWTVCWKASTPLKYGTEKQRREFLLPINAGKSRACYAITEPQAGSDPSMVKTTA